MDFYPNDIASALRFSGEPEAAFFNAMLSKCPNAAYALRLQDEYTHVQQLGLVKRYMQTFALVEYLKQNGVQFGAAPGTMNAMLMHFLLGLTTVNPLPYNLLSALWFEQPMPAMACVVHTENKSILSRHAIECMSLGLELHSSKMVQLLLPDYGPGVYTDGLRNMADSTIDFVPAAMGFDEKAWKTTYSHFNPQTREDLMHTIALQWPGMHRFIVMNKRNGGLISEKHLKECPNILLYKEDWLQYVCTIERISMSAALDLFNTLSRETDTTALDQALAQGAITHREWFLQTAPIYLPTKAHCAGVMEYMMGVSCALNPIESKYPKSHNPAEG